MSLRRTALTFVAITACVAPAGLRGQGFVTVFDVGMVQTTFGNGASRTGPGGGVALSMQLLGMDDFIMSLAGDSRISQVTPLEFGGGLRSVFSYHRFGAGVNWFLRSIQRPDTVIGPTTIRLGRVAGFAIEGTAKLSLGATGRTYTQARYQYYASCNLSGSSLTDEIFQDGKCHDIAIEIGRIMHGTLVRAQVLDRDLKFPRANENAADLFNQHTQFATLGFGLIF
jgi:hypothetical protein